MQSRGSVDKSMCVSSRHVTGNVHPHLSPIHPRSILVSIITVSWQKRVPRIMGQSPNACAPIELRVCAECYHPYRTCSYDYGRVRSSYERKSMNESVTRACVRRCCVLYPVRSCVRTGFANEYSSRSAFTRRISFTRAVHQ